jgi:gluconolactonase
VKLTVEDTVYPNGLCFSPTRSILYVNDTRLGLIRAFDVNADGSVRNGRVFTPSPAPRPASPTA